MFQIGSHTRRLAIGRGHDQFLEEGLQIPLEPHEFGGEPVEEFGVKRLLSLSAEVLAAGDDADAEDLLPAAVGNDTGGERVGVVYQPPGQSQAVARGAFGQRREYGGRAFCNGLAHVEEVAAVLDLGDTPLSLNHFAHNRHRGRFHVREFFGQIREPLAEGLQFRGQRAVVLRHCLELSGLAPRPGRL